MGSYTTKEYRGILLGITKLELPLRGLQPEERVEIARMCRDAVTKKAAGAKDTEIEQWNPGFVDKIETGFMGIQVVITQERLQLHCEDYMVSNQKLTDLSAIVSIRGSDGHLVIIGKCQKREYRVALVLDMFSDEQADEIIRALKPAINLMKNTPKPSLNQLRSGQQVRSSTSLPALNSTTTTNSIDIYEPEPETAAASNRLDGVNPSSVASPIPRHLNNASPLSGRPGASSLQSNHSDLFTCPFSTQQNSLITPVLHHSSASSQLSSRPAASSAVANRSVASTPVLNQTVGAPPVPSHSLVVTPVLSQPAGATPVLNQSRVTPVSTQLGGTLPVPNHSGVFTPVFNQHSRAPPVSNHSGIATPVFRQPGEAPPVPNQSGVFTPVLSQSSGTPPVPNHSSIATPVFRQPGEAPPVPNQSGAFTPVLSQSSGTPPVPNHSSIATPVFRQPGEAPPVPNQSGVFTPVLSQSSGTPPAPNHSSIATSAFSQPGGEPSIPNQSGLATPAYSQSDRIAPALRITTGVISPASNNPRVVRTISSQSDVSTFVPNPSGVASNNSPVPSQAGVAATSISMSNHSGVTRPMSNQFGAATPVLNPVGASTSVSHRSSVPTSMARQSSVASSETNNAELYENGDSPERSSFTNEDGENYVNGENYENDDEPESNNATLATSQATIQEIRPNYINQSDVSHGERSENVVPIQQSPLQMNRPNVAEPSPVAPPLPPRFTGQNESTTHTGNRDLQSPLWQSQPPAVRRRTTVSVMNTATETTSNVYSASTRPSSVYGTTSAPPLPSVPPPLPPRNDEEHRRKISVRLRLPSVFTANNKHKDKQKTKKEKKNEDKYTWNPFRRKEKQKKSAYDVNDIEVVYTNNEGIYGSNNIAPPPRTRRLPVPPQPVPTPNPIPSPPQTTLSPSQMSSALRQEPVLQQRAPVAVPTTPEITDAAYYSDDSSEFQNEGDEEYYTTLGISIADSERLSLNLLTGNTNMPSQSLKEAINDFLVNEYNYLGSIERISKARSSFSPQLQVLLRGTEALYDTHNTMYGELYANKNSCSKIARVFISNRKELELYKYYMMNSPQIKRHLENLPELLKKKYPQLKDDIQGSWKRLHYYYMNLEKMLSTTNEEDKTTIKEAVEMLRNLHLQADSGILIDSVKGSPYDLHLRAPLLLHHSFKITYSSLVKARLYRVLLFADVIVVTIPRIEQYDYQMDFRIEQTNFLSCEEVGKFLLEVDFGGGKGKQILTFKASEEYIKEIWCNEIKKLQVAHAEKVKAERNKRFGIQS